MNSPASVQKQFLKQDFSQNGKELQRKFIQNDKQNIQMSFLNYQFPDEIQQSEDESKTNNLSFKQKVLKRRNSSKLMNNFFGSPTSRYENTSNSQSERVYLDTVRLNQAQMLSPKTFMSGSVTPTYQFYNGLQIPQNKYMKQDQHQTSSNKTNAINEKLSIAQRLNSLKKFYNAQGPPVDKSIIVKAQYLQIKIQQSDRNQHKNQNTYQNDNLDIEQNLNSKNDNLTQRDVFSPVSTALPSTSIHMLQLNQVNRQKIKSPSLLYSEQNDAQNKVVRKSIDFQKENKQIHPDIQDIFSPRQSKLNIQSQSRHSLLFQESRAENTYLATDIRNTQSKINQNQQEQEQMLKTPISQMRQLSLDGYQKKNKKSINIKNLQLKGTEKYFKIEMQNLQQISGDKFTLCAEYEAHRNFKSDPNTAEKVFLQQMDAILPQIKEIIKLISYISQHTKDVNQVDQRLTEINNLALQTKCGYLQVICLLFSIKIYYEYRDYIKVINLSKKAKNMAQVFGYMFEKMKIYELIGQAYNQIQRPKLSIIYQIKVLRLSWLLQNENHELKAYDQLGKCYYYLGDLEKAYYYHEKMMIGEIEKDQSIIQLSNSKLLNREYRSNIDTSKKKKLQMENNQELTEEDECISSSDDEFEINVSFKAHTNGNTQILEQQNESKDALQLTSKNRNQQSLGWNDKLILARLKVLQIQRTKEMKSFSKNKSVTAADLQQQEVGKVKYMMDTKGQEYLQKILNKKGKSTNILKKYRISHLTPNRTILSYHEAESQFLKQKNYSSQQDFIPTIDSQNLKKINQILLKFNNFFNESAQIILQILVNFSSLQNNINISKYKQDIINSQQNKNFYSSKDYKFKKMQEKDNKF
ncbi:proteindeformylase family protein (macronuclear) [Tetrahymena thermophila SB210]|uniref:Proteindeformylase family protein n=1 Tax=Tetrahymena thermophila (strain SB210) TaxID=312017 RepID=I7LX88_TETTS|nr:proteindeformylase family protein [Tetrahymena thermophila SB210]EAS03967.2 proteindeformylase family protein [Tetrahymena thermophila SB210]|eukprot:XP_001024212.2 proteindeformylase family protein [Tetrahymena thermophila SB210]